LIRVQRTAEDPKTGEITVGNRFYVSSKSPDALGTRSALKISRAHWRCENCTHWTADAELQEDRRRLAWSRHSGGALAVSALRMMALAILAVARRMTRMEYSRETPSWAQVADNFLLELCDSILDTQAFDNV
jgi:predicted transposase YbfD/YdcC